MRLKSFTARNYRSITEAYKLPLGNYSVLVGPNNEGKSNILKAIVTSLRLLSEYHEDLSRKRTIRIRDAGQFDYDWNRDYPVNLQADGPEGESEFTLEFELGEADFSDFKKQVGVNLQSDLKLRLRIGQQQFTVEPLMKGPAKKALSNKLQEIASFIGKRIDIQYIPAIRPSELAVDVVERMLRRELAHLEEDPNYQKLIVQIEKAQKPVLDGLAKELLGTIRSFVGEVKSVSLDTKSRLRRAISGSCRVLIDDGVATDLESKGDGIKSLAAISLLRHTSHSKLGNRSLVLAVEEPEAHLHPKAIHRLREVLQEMSESHQVIVTTHSPSLIDRVSVGRNIIVQNGTAEPATRLADIRDALGVEISDNLAGAYLVLLVEGEEDKKLLSAWLPAVAPFLGECLSKGLLAIDHLGGASNLRYKARLYRTLLCNIHAYMDNDEEGRKAIEDSEGGGLLEPSNYNLTVCRGMQNSELEDLIVLESYADAMKDAFGVEVRCKFMSNAGKKWSDRVRDCCENQGKAWSKKLEERMKGVAIDAAVAKSIDSLNPHHRGSIDALAKLLAERLAKVT